MAGGNFIVMPAYNAGRTIERVFERIPETVRQRITRYVVVDDGSKDDTWEAILRLQKQFPNLDPLRHPANRGYGAAEKTLLQHAVKEGAGIVILLHSDGQYSPEVIPAMLQPFDRGQADLVMGSRMLGGGALKGGMPLYKYVANKSLTALENLAFGLRMAEYHSGFLVYNRKLLEAVPFEKLSDSFDFDLEMVVMAKIKGLRIREVAIPTIYADEESHLNPIKYGFNVLRVIRDYKLGRYGRL